MIQGYDPRTGKPVGEPVLETPAAGVDAMAELAAEVAGEWAGLARPARADMLVAVADALDSRAAELVALADAETALGETRLTGEVARTTGQLRLFADVLRDGGYLDVVHSPGPPDLRRINRPVGPVAVFAASNFPFAFSVAGGDTASALAAGCPVIVKAHEGHPRTSVATGEAVASALAAAGAPSGVFGLVHGVDAGVALLRHPLLAAAGFTGSARGGLALQRICAERAVPIPFFGELGSVNPVVVLPGAASARPDAIASGYAGSLTLGAGQFCTNPGLLFVPEDAGLLEAVAAAVSAAAGGPMLSERIHSGFVTGVDELAGHSAVRPLATGQPGEGPWAATPRAFQVGLDDFAAGLPTLAGERFGPAGLVITYPDVESLVAVLARLGGNLAGCLHLDEAAAGDVAAARQVMEAFVRTAGRVVVNGWPTGVAVAWAQHHGGPWPATTAPAYTSVGAAAIRRWLVPVVYQDCPPALLPPWTVNGMNELPVLVDQACALARRLGFPLTRQEADGIGPGVPSACLPGVGRFLAVLAAGCAGGQIGEIGTGVGIGAAWMAAAMPADCSLVTVEIDEERAAAARSLFAGDSRVTVLTGDARAVLGSYAPFDLLFADGGWRDPAGLASLVELVRVGGQVVMDDVTPGAPAAGDVKRELFFGDSRLLSVEVVLPDLRNSLLLGTRLS